MKNGNQKRKLDKEQEELYGHSATVVQLNISNRANVKVAWRRNQDGKTEA